MALALTAAALASGSKAFGVSFQLSDFSGSYNDMYGVFGTKASGTPAVYTDFSGAQIVTVTYASILQITRQPGRFSMSGTVEFGDAGSVGDRGFFALFGSYPSGSDAPIAVAGPYVLGA